MALELNGKIVAIMPEQTGSGKNGTWVKQEFVIETTEQFPKKVCLQAWGDKAASLKKMAAGYDVKVSFNAESREFNGKWYTDLRIWKIELLENAAGTAHTDNTPPLPDEDYFSAPAGPESDLPF
jgi:hypothetical protein